MFPEPIDPTGKPLVVQYEVKLQKGLECGGAYIKLLTESEDGNGLRAGEEYTDKVSSKDCVTLRITLDDNRCFVLLQIISTSNWDSVNSDWCRFFSDNSLGLGFLDLFIRFLLPVL